MLIRTSDLKLVSQLLLNHLENTGIEHVELSKDYYWNIPEEECYNVYQNPSELNIGQLTDDWAELEKILHGNNEPLSYALIWLAAVLRAVGEEVVM